MKKRIFLLWALASFGLFSLGILGCGESSSSSGEIFYSSGEVPHQSSDSKGDLEGEEQIPSSSSGELTGEISPSDPSENTAWETLAKEEDGFIPIATVYQMLGENERAVFLLRHAERESSLDSETPLTEAGVLAAFAAGEALSSGENFNYASSGFVRTTATCEHMARGRGETAEVEEWIGLDGNWFLTDPENFEQFAKTKGGSWKIVARWAYQDPTMSESLKELVNAQFYDLTLRSEEYINEVILPHMSPSVRVNVFVSHDMLVMPLVVYATQREIDLKFHDGGNWLNYLAGLAIIQSGDKVHLLPIKGMATGIARVNKSE